MATNLQRFTLYYGIAGVLFPEAVERTHLGR